MAVKKAHVDELFESPGDDKLIESVDLEQDKPISFEDGTDIETEIGKPEIKKRRRRSPNKVKKVTEDEALKASKIMLNTAMAHSLTMLAASAAMLTQNPVWMITDPKESQELAGVVNSYLDARFPNWVKVSPEVNLGLGILNYFGKRIPELPKVKQMVTDMFRQSA